MGLAFHNSRFTPRADVPLSLPLRLTFLSGDYPFFRRPCHPVHLSFIVDSILHFLHRFCSLLSARSCLFSYLLPQSTPFPHSHVPRYLSHDMWTHAHPLLRSFLTHKRQTGRRTSTPRPAWLLHGTTSPKAVEISCTLRISWRLSRRASVLKWHKQPTYSNASKSC